MLTNKQSKKLKLYFRLLIVIGCLVVVFVYMESNDVLNMIFSAEAFQKYI